MGGLFPKTVSPSTIFRAVVNASPRPLSMIYLYACTLQFLHVAIKIKIKANNFTAQTTSTDFGNTIQTSTAQTSLIDFGNIIQTPAAQTSLTDVGNTMQTPAAQTSLIDFGNTIQALMTYLLLNTIKLIGWLSNLQRT